MTHGNSISASISAARVLLAEDQGIVRAIIVEMLKGLGVAGVVAVPDAIVAWKKLDGAEGQFDLVITDINMPGMSGEALIQKIRADARPGVHALPVIVLTADESYRAGRKLPDTSVQCLMKPIKAPALREAMESALAAA